MLAIILWIAVIGFFILGYYVNHNMPKGPMYPTGEVVCMNDDRGPCGEKYVEDVRNLPIPDWAKWLKNDGDGLIMILIILAIIASSSFKKEND